MVRGRVNIKYVMISWFDTVRVFMGYGMFFFSKTRRIYLGFVSGIGCDTVCYDFVARYCTFCRVWYGMV